MKGARIVFAALLTASIASISFMGATLANFERAAQITHSNEVASGGKKNIDLYLKADSIWFLSPGAAPGVDVYTVFLLKWRESDTSVFEWTKCPTTATTINVNSVDTNYYKFSFDTTKYDHLSFHRIKNDKLTAENGCDANGIPENFSAKNRPDGGGLCENLSHTLTMPSTSNVYKITDWRSLGDYWFLSWGSWLTSAAEYGGVLSS